jgi:predicted RNase H-like nuclease (RuvC/YqgF family)
VLGCRRRRSTKATEIPAAERPESPKETNNPFDGSNTNRESWELHVDRHQTQEHRLSYNTVSTRQLYISNQVNRAREKVAELEAMSTLLRSSTMSSRGSGSRPGSEITATAVGDEGVNGDDSELRRVQETLERAMQQIEGLNNQIRELEMHRIRLSAEPPDYFE